MSTTTVTVSIGRNVGVEPLSNEDWEQFRTHVALAVDDAVHDLSSARTLFYGQGVGVWENTIEDAYSVIFAYDDPTDTDGHILRSLRSDLHTAALVFHQEAIAYTEGTTVLL